MSFGRRRIESPYMPDGKAFPLPPHETAFLSVVSASVPPPNKEELIPIIRHRIPAEEVRTLTRG